MWHLTSHMLLRVYLVSPFAEWGQSLIYCLGLLAYNTYMPFNLGLDHMELVPWDFPKAIFNTWLP